MNELQYLEEKYKELLTRERISITSDRKWLNKIQKEPGVYIIEVHKKIVYVGETGNLNKRMRVVLA